MHPVSGEPLPQPGPALALARTDASAHRQPLVSAGQVQSELPGCHPAHVRALMVGAQAGTSGGSQGPQTPKSPIERCSYGHETPFG